MRARTPRRAAWLVAVAAFTAAAFTSGGASANHDPAPPTPETHIGQGGRGGESLPVIEDFNVGAVLFDPLRFPVTLPQGGVVARPGFTRYLAYGLLRVPSPTGPTGVFASQLALSMSENGLDWSTPRRATLRDPETGEDLPFIMNEPHGFFDVVFAPNYIYPTTGLPQGLIQIFYRTLDGDITDVASIHNALSDDGVTFYDDISIGQTGTPVVTGNPADFNGASHGPTDVVYQAGKSDAADCAAVDPDGAGPLLPSPWNCRYVMLYDAVLNGDIEQVGIASSADGFTFTGFTDPINNMPRPLLFAGAAGEWDDNAATLATVRIRPNTVDPRFPFYDLYYSGGRLPDDTCFAGGAGCWSLGTAMSPGTAAGQGLVYTKTALNPVTPHELLESFQSNSVLAGATPYTLWKPVVVDDGSFRSGNGGGHAAIYYNRITNGDGSDLQTVSRDVFLAFSEPAPEQKPRIRIATPIGPFRNRADTPLEFYITDTLGSTPAKTNIDLTTLLVKIDGIVVPGGWTPVFPHLVGALSKPSTKFFAPSGLNLLADGLHTFEVSIADLDLNVATATTAFVVDTTAPTTTLLTHPDDGAIGFPLASIGTFTGKTAEGSPTTGTAIDRLDVYVTNPLGQEKIYEVKGALVQKVDAKNWNWSWVAPTPDPFLALPGFYTFSFRAADVAQNREDATAANTVTVLVI